MRSHISVLGCHISLNDGVKSTMNSKFQTVVDELSELFKKFDPSEVEKISKKIISANHISVYGAGRERLQIMGFAMRLHHLGLSVSVVGDMTTPPLGRGDLFLTSCGPGQLSTVTALASRAKNAGAKVIIITAQSAGESIELADDTILLPAQTMADDTSNKRRSFLSMGSIFEGGLFIFFEVVILHLKDALQISDEQMRSKHTNLE